MIGLIVEFCLVVCWFLWLHRRQVRERDRAKRVPPRQLTMELQNEDGPDYDREDTARF